MYGHSDTVSLQLSKEQPQKKDSSPRPGNQMCLPPRKQVIVLPVKAGLPA